MTEDRAAAEKALKIMVNKLSSLEKLVFESRFIGPDAFCELVTANKGLREVCIRVYPRPALDADVDPF